MVAAVMLGLVVLGYVRWHEGRIAERLGSQGDAPRAATVREAGGEVADTAPADVEVPDLAGLTVAEARVLLRAAGLKVKVSVDPDAPAADEAPRVLSQEPEGGAIAEAGSYVTVTTPRDPDTGSVDPASRSGLVVVIDPGHQSRSDLELEPVGPGSEDAKPRITGGSTGVETGLAEHEVVLQISTVLKRELEDAGVEVVMTRTTNDVRLSNAERASIANEAGADLFVRVHAGSSPDEDPCGVAVLYPNKNQWTGPIASPSKRAADLIRLSTVKATGAADRGIAGCDGVAGFNWSKVPAVIVETGMLSNPVEDRLLASPGYQDRLAHGIADGVVRFLDAEASY